MKIIIAGGDGFCGWPTALHLSSSGFDVIIVDNLSRRKIDIELEVNSLTPISTINLRIKKWMELTGKKIQFFNIDLSKNYQKFLNLIKEEKPSSIIHFCRTKIGTLFNEKFSYKNLYNK